MSLRALTCSPMTELVTDYLEGALTEDDEVAFETHIVYCPGCSVFFDQIRSTVDALHALPAAPPSADERAEVLDAYADRR